MHGVPNPFIPRPQLVQKGNLKIYPQSASIDGDIGVNGKVQIFCKLHLGRGLLESVPDKKNDRHPVWTQELTFRRESESDLIINLYHKNLLLAPSYLCECRINLTGVIQNRQVTVSPDLQRKGNTVGTMKVLMKWEPDNNYAYVQPPQNIQYMQPSQSNQFVFAPQGYQVAQNFAPYNPAQTGHVVNSIQIMSSSYNGHNPQSGPYGQPQYFQPMMRPGSAQINMHHSQPPQNNSMINVSVQQMPKKEEKKVIVEALADPDLPEEQKCVICLDRKKAGAFYKCGHNCCCVTCGTDFIGKLCPICREPVLDFIKVYDA